MNLRYALDFLRRRGWLLVLACILAGGSAYYFSMQMTPIYRATTTILVNQTQSQGVIQYNDILTSERLTSTYAELAKRRPILTEVARRLSLPTTEAELAAQINVSPVRNTQLLRIAVEDSNPARAADIANTTAQAFIDENSAQLGNRPGSVSIAERAAVPAVPVKPNVRLNTALAAFLGLLIGGMIGLLIDYLDNTVKTSRDVEALTGLPTLGTVTRFRGQSRKGRLAGDAPDGLEPQSSEAFRQIRTNIHFSMLRQGPKSVLVTSTHPGEGKTTTAVNLAVVLAQAGHKVILVDTDLRRPTVHTHFGVANSLGLTGILLSQSLNIEAGLTKTAIPGLRLLTSGPLPPNPSEILMSREAQQIFDALKLQAEYLILDSPPVLAVTDACLLAGQADATILVIEQGKTRSDAFQRSCEALGQVNAKVIGVVLNKLKSRKQGYYTYTYQTDGQQAAMNPARPKNAA
ncbi:MAG TPA: polysaccharide biosynthesis tyrosine autokinase [Dehalococcoidia bacterium]|nr:polysaccharide biosynthesis tyrosine autokinase [Dehalococcoidia bacterium]